MANLTDSESLTNESVTDGEHSSNTTSSGSITTNCIKCNCLLNKDNSKRRNKRCNSCLQMCRSGRLPSDGKIACSKRKNYKETEQFIKICKLCEPCRESKKKTTAGNEDVGDNNNELENYENVHGVTALEIYNFLKDKYKIKEDLKEIVQQIIKQN